MFAEELLLSINKQNQGGLPMHSKTRIAYRNLIPGENSKLKRDQLVNDNKQVNFTDQNEHVSIYQRGLHGKRRLVTSP